MRANESTDQIICRFQPISYRVIATGRVVPCVACEISRYSLTPTPPNDAVVGFMIQFRRPNLMAGVVVPHSPL